MSIFQKSVIKNYLAGIDKEQVEKAYQIFQKNYSPEKTALIKTLKEEEYQDGFLRDIFVDVLGYTLKPDAGFNLVREFKNPSDGRKADGAVLKNDKASAVIELKSTKTKDLKMITEQAFSYKNNQPDCKYVITSNFQKLRFYIDYANAYEEFDLFRLDREDFERMFLILCRESILNDRPEKLKKESVSHEENVSKQLYTDYSVFRKKLFENLAENNPDIDRLTLFGKAQKLIDRFLFILFAEDKGLLPPNSINRIIERFHTLREEDAYKPLYEIFKQYFGYMNIGRKGKRTTDDIPAYNGGLFYPDEVLYGLKIGDDVLVNDLQKLSAYNFDTEVDVNILGHIFEHSLSEIEETTARIKGTDIDKTRSRRKKDGIFYTPQYITQYIVENTVGRLCGEKRKELDIDEIEVDDSFYTKKGELSKKGSMLYQKLEDYKNWLLSLKILDPACGSGAFLNQALSFLIREHQFIIEIQTDLKKGQVSMFNIETAVLENNLYGLDINEESVEITKLSLWLRTANKERKLSNLSSNIRCGNSLIDDPEIAGEKAFNWEKEFSGIMENGGFDAVIGNPPYFNIQTMGAGSPYAAYLQEKYADIWMDKSDILFYFIRKAIELSKSEICFIVSNAFLFSDKARKLRNYILDNTSVIKIINFEQFMVFQDASITSAIIHLSKNKHLHQTKAFILKDKSYSGEAVCRIISDEKNAISLTLKKESVFALADDKTDLLNQKIDSKGKKLGEMCLVGKGMETAADNIFTFKEYPGQFPSEFIKKRVTGLNTERYCIYDDAEYILYFEDTENFKDLPETIQSYLFENKAILEKRATVKNEGRVWWRYSRPMHKDYYHLPKLFCSRRSFNNTFSFDSGFEFLSFSNMTVIFETNQNFSIKYILTLLNSKVLNFRYKSLGKQTGGGSFEYFPNGVSKLPIPDISLNRQKSFVEKADIMLSKNKELHELKADFLNFFKSELTPQKISKKLENWNELDPEQFKKESEKCKVKELSLKDRKEWQDYFIEHKEKADKIKSVIDSTDKEIDLMVYQLYGLTQEEIEIVEKSGSLG